MTKEEYENKLRDLQEESSILKERMLGYNQRGIFGFAFASGPFLLNLQNIIDLKKEYIEQ